MDEKEKVSRKLRAMKKYVDFLKEYRSISKEELEKNDMLKAAIERNFQLAIESALDIGEVIISTRDFEKPEDYRDIILILGKQGVLPVDFAQRFSKAAGFRNILVHMYEEVDAGKLQEYLQKNLEDFNEYAKCIAKCLELK
ncbi:Uncharacterised protein [uncultured archaeon]|nr:Uncharacterised protein [uncultured archaeon]